MKVCPVCGKSTRVVESRAEGEVVRRRKCLSGHTFYTAEIEFAQLNAAQRVSARESWLKAVRGNERVRRIKKGVMT